MLKYLPVAFAVIAIGALAAFDFMGFKGRSAEIASLHDAATKIDADFEAVDISYADHLLSKFGLADGLPDPSMETARLERQVLRAKPLNSYLPTPSEETLMGWERLAWKDEFHNGFGWPDGLKDGKASKYAPDLENDIAIYLKGRSSIFLQVEYSEPTDVLAKRLKQSYWVVETGRSLDRLLEGRPRASYFWTNIQESSRGKSVYNAKDQKHFHQVAGVHWLTAKNKKAGRDEKMRYMFATLNGGVVLKLRAHAPESAIKEIIDAIDYQSLNQLQTLPSPLIAEGLGEHVIDTPDAWLEAHGKGVPAVSHGAEIGKGSKDHSKEAKLMPKAHKGGFGADDCAHETGKTCKVSVN